LVNELKVSRKDEDLEKIDSLISVINSEMQKISTRIYSETQNSDGNGQEVHASVNEEDVEFEEVK
jgi:hypothetical protein